MADNQIIKTCPRCKTGRYVTYDADPATRQVAMMQGIMPPALSRADNLTDVCSDCGTDEALVQFSGERLTTPDEWRTA